MNFSVRFAPSLLVAAFLLGCGQDPTSVGTRLIPAAEKFSAHDTSIHSVSDTTYLVAPANGNGASVLAGRSSGVEARALLRFVSAIPESLTTVKVDSAVMTLTVNYSWNMVVPSGLFEILEVTTPWSGSTVTADSLRYLNFVPTKSSLIGGNDTISIGKTMAVLFDTSVVRKWIDISVDSTKPRFFSAAIMPIMPKSGQGDVGIWGFSPFGTASPPSLKIYYTKNGVQNLTELSTGEDTFLATRAPFQRSGFIETQGGVSVRSKINFDLRSVSGSTNKAIVNHADMELTLNNAQSVVGIGSPDSVLALAGADGVKPDSVSLAYYSFGYRKDPSQPTNSVYIFNVTAMVQQWIGSPTTNFGVVLHSATDASSVDNLKFYSSNDSAKGPKLVIKFTRK